jgi:hypothetical protein
MFDDNLIETKKFQMYADKADTEAKRIELCTKYLKSKDALPKPPMPPIEYRPDRDDWRYVGPDLYHRIKVSTEMDMLDFEQNRSDAYNHMRVSLANEIKTELIRENLIVFHPVTEPYEHRFRLLATIDVVKKRESK